MFTVVIPTNRYTCIKKILQDCICSYNGKLFLFEIHDSSCDNRIEILINKIAKTSSATIHYFHYNSDISADFKAIQALRKVNTAFFWLMGDGILVDFTKMENLFIKEKYWQFDLIDVESILRIGYLGQDSKYQPNRLYSCLNPKEYAKKYFSHLTYWGASLIKTAFYQDAFSNEILGKYVKENIPWWIACSLFDVVAKMYQQKQSVTLGVIYADGIGANTEKKDHWWTHDKRYYEYTFVNFNRGIELLSCWYEPTDKKQIIKQFRQDSLVSKRYLIHLRRIGTLNVRSVRKYKFAIYNIPSTYMLMFLYSLIPRCIALIADEAQVCLKPIYIKLKKRIMRRRFT